jgi:hypothetical protein
MPIELIRDFEGFRDAIAVRRREARDSERGTSFRFSVFEVLGVHRLEKFHSRFLASLLDPAGTHAQGSLFLERFLDHCAKKDGRFAYFRNQLSGQELDRWHVRTEELLETGRADIWLQSPSGSEAKVAIIVENKIDAPESERQLERYGEIVYSRHLGALVYLTPSGAESKTCGRYKDRYVRLSYSKDVVTWLTDCIATIGSPRIRETVGEYVDSVRNLDKQEEKLMPGDEKILEYFNQAENLEAVLEIGRYANKICAELRKQFPMQLCQNLTDRLKGWRLIRRDDKQNPSNFMWDWISDPARDNNKYLRPRVGHDNQSLFVGVYVGSAPTEGDTRQHMRDLLTRCPEVGRLRTQLVETPGQWDKQGQYGSLAFKYLDFNLKEARHLGRFGSNKQVVVQDLGEEITRLFESIKPLLTAANDCIEKLNGAA